MCLVIIMAKRTLDSAKTKKSRLLKAKEKKSYAATIKDLPVKIVLPLNGLPDSNNLRPREQSIPLHGVTCSSTQVQLTSWETNH